MFQSLLHYFLHFFAIAGIAWYYDPAKWKKYWLILLSTMLVDADHLLASPLFDATRCSIGYHPLHSYPAIAFYILGVLFLRHKLLRIIAIGLLFHMLTDFLDCLLMC